MIYAKYDHEIVSSTTDIRFSPVVSDVDKAKKMFDSLIRDSPKFMCLNDAMDHDSVNQPEIEKLYSGFHEKMFPSRCPLEHQHGQINEYLNIEHYNEQKQKVHMQSIGEIINVKFNDRRPGNGELFIVATMSIVLMFIVFRLFVGRNVLRKIIRINRAFRHFLQRNNI